MVFSGMAGNGRLRHWLGKEGSSLLRMVPAAGAECASCHDIRFKLLCNCGRAAAAFVYVPHNCTTVLRSLQLLGISGCIPDYCVSSKAKSLKQLRPASTEQSGMEWRRREAMFAGGRAPNMGCRRCFGSPVPHQDEGAAGRGTGIAGRYRSGRADGNLRAPANLPQFYHELGRVAAGVEVVGLASLAADAGEQFLDRAG